MTLEHPVAVRAPRNLAEAAEAHLDDVLGYLLYLTRDRETAEDLTSATFEKALRLWARFDATRGSARTWLLGIARTTALDWFRAETRRRKREEAAALPEREQPQSRAHDVPHGLEWTGQDLVGSNDARLRGKSGLESPAPRDP